MRRAVTLILAAFAAGSGSVALAQSSADPILNQLRSSQAPAATAAAAAAPTGAPSANCVTEQDLLNNKECWAQAPTDSMRLWVPDRQTSATSSAPRIRTASYVPSRPRPARAPRRTAVATDAAAAAYCQPDEVSGEAAANLCATFALNSAELTARTRKTLDDLAPRLASDPEWSKIKFLVQGHADARGEAEHNHELSLQRANAIRNYLIAKGVAADRLGVVGFGAERPIAGRSPMDPMNRRVQIVIQS